VQIPFENGKIHFEMDLEGQVLTLTEGFRFHFKMGKSILKWKNLF